MVLENSLWYLCNDAQKVLEVMQNVACVCKKRGLGGENEFEKRRKLKVLFLAFALRFVPYKFSG